MLLHDHHIWPQHAIGPAPKNNLLRCNVAMHAFLHKLEYEKWGRWQDKVAWQTLSGLIGKEEMQLEILRNIDRSWCSSEWNKQRLSKLFTGRAPPNKGKTKHNDEGVRKGALAAKLAMAEGRLYCIGDHWRGKKFSTEHKNKLKAARNATPKITCQNCEKSFHPSHFARYHGEKCKSRSRSRRP